MIADTETRTSVFDDLAAQWYRDQDSADRLLTDAPLVEIVFDPPAPSPS